MDITRHVKWLKIPVFLLCLGPTAVLTWKFFTDKLGANPLEVLQHSTGNWALIFLCITLAITPFRRLLHQNWLIRFRRMAGLFAFWYGCLHLATYVVFDQFFDFRAMLHDVVKRPFITAGMTAFTLMVPLAITSTSGWVRRMGGKRWQLLHRAVYFSAIAGVVHYYWLVKSDETMPVRFAVVVGLLLGYRVVHSLMEKKRRPAMKKVAAKQPAISS
jgi:sulfoxide reductase heme-binding subunit YedZ